MKREGFSDRPPLPDFFNAVSIDDDSWRLSCKHCGINLVLSKDAVHMDLLRDLVGHIREHGLLP
jgi:hypothetical protein